MNNGVNQKVEHEILEKLEHFIPMLAKAGQFNAVAILKLAIIELSRTNKNDQKLDPNTLVDPILMSLTKSVRKNSQ